MERLKRILILEPEEDHLMINLLQHILEKQHFWVSIAKESLEAFKSTHPQEFDLVIADILHASEEGLQNVKFAKENLKHTAVLVLSQLGEDQKNIEEAFKLGADDFISKPFNPSELIIRVKKLLTPPFPYSA